MKVKFKEKKLKIPLVTWKLRWIYSPKKKSGKWMKWLGVALVLLLLSLGGRREYSRSQVWGSRYRFNLALAVDDGQVAFVSFDPEEKQIFVISYPMDLEIKSRSVGEYRVGSLYKLGEYADEGGEFVRRKMQGFMRVPILGFLKVKSHGHKGVKANLRRGLWKTMLTGGKDSSLSSWDAGLLIWRTATYFWKEVDETELKRAGVIERREEFWQYYPERLKQYLVMKVFDWMVGETSVTVTIINASGENGLGSDISEFLRNMGFDVVAVRGGENQEVRQTSSLLIEKEKATKHQKLIDLLGNLFHWTEVTSGSTSEYRSEMVVTLGRDAMELF